MPAIIPDYAACAQRRNELLKRVNAAYPAVTSGVMLFFADFEPERIAFRQESSFYYLTGLAEPGAVLAIYLDGRQVVYMPAYATSRNQWVNVSCVAGEQNSGDAKRLGVYQIKNLGQEISRGYAIKPLFEPLTYQQLLADVASAVGSNGTLFTLLNVGTHQYLMQTIIYKNFLEALNQPGIKTQDVSVHVHALRRDKSEDEMSLIGDAVQITVAAHEVAAQMIAAGTTEYEIQAVIDGTFLQLGAMGPAFPSIVGSGRNSTVLHYVDNMGDMRDGDLVVVDIGAEYNYYCADLTRTYPVAKMFTPRQLEIYNAVLETQEYVASLAEAGMYLRNDREPEKSLHHHAVKHLQQYKLDKYFPHGIGHFLGMDVHDVGNSLEPLKIGDVFTIEPGVYIRAEGIGVRIEDNYALVEDGCVCLSDELPKEADAVEDMMNSSISLEE